MSSSLTAQPAHYRGRFAPSPTGPLHFGSLVAAVGSYLDARRHGGEWLLRMEDVDTPRNVPGAAESILETLEAFGFEWDGPVLYQSSRFEAYAAALEKLKGAGLAYGCACSRKEIADSATRPAIDGGLAYPGTCRDGLPGGREAPLRRIIFAKGLPVSSDAPDALTYTRQGDVTTIRIGDQESVEVPDALIVGG